MTGPIGRFPPSAAPDAIEGAGGVVFDPTGRKVLLIRYQNGTWVFPKGHRDPGESLLDAARREVLEEAGVRADCPDPDLTWETRYTNARGQPRRITWFLLVSVDPTPVLREPLFSAADYLPADDALARLSFEEDRELLRRALPHAPTPASTSGDA